jgi:glycerophosphoryl diester phosphodiesterase
MLSALVVTTTTAQADITAGCTGLQIIAHRGYHIPASANIHENTLTAFTTAAARGYDIETDVRQDADGVLWIMHDPDVYRDTGVHGLIADMTTEQVSQLRTKVTNQPIPTLQQTLDAFAQTDPSRRLYLEVKLTSDLQQAAQMIEASGVANRIYVTAHTQEMHAIDPNIKLLLKSYSSLPDPATLPQQGVQIIGLLITQITPSVVAMYHQAGIEVQAGRANTTGKWNVALSADVDGILTDLPDTLNAYCGQPPPASPVINGFSPVTGAVGTTVTIAGSGFTGATAVTFGTVAATFTVDSDTQITTTVPTGTPASSKIRVTGPSGSSLSATSFKIPPTVTGFTPASGPVGTTVTITGSGFTGVTAVAFGTVAASFTVDSDTQISVTVPTGAPASSKIRVTSPGGVALTGTPYKIPPTVTGFTPASGPVGTTVTITGTGFTGATAVAFGTVAAAFTVVSDTEISATVPAGAPATSTIRVTTPGGTTLSAGTFSVG